MANVNLSNSKPSSVSVPPNYPMVPTPGKISLLFDANQNNIYHKFNAKGYDGGNVFFGSNQPYIYRYPGDKSGGLGFVRTLLGSGTDDLVRVTKFLGSGRGLMFIRTQLSLQGGQPFDETNTYNPTEVVLTATSNAFGALISRPKRHIDKSGGLLGGLASMIGIGISRGGPPPSTVAAGNGKGGSSEGGFLSGFSLLGGGGNNRETEVLPVQNYGNGTGLLRAKTSDKGISIFKSKWGVSGGGSMLSYVENFAKSMFPQLSGTDKQNYKQRADDTGYDMMVEYYNKYTAKGQAVGSQSSGMSLSFLGISFKKPSSSTTISKISNSNTQLFEQKYYKDLDGESKIYSVDGAYIKTEDNAKSEIQIRNKEWLSEAGIEELQKQKDKYFDTVSWKIADGKSVTENAFKKYTEDGKQVNQNELTKESTYVKTYDENNKPVWVTGFKNDKANQLNSRVKDRNTKLNKVDDNDSPAAQVNSSLKKVIDNINMGGFYKAEFKNKDTRLLSSGKSSKQGYDRLYLDVSDKNSMETGNIVQSFYKNQSVKTLDSIINPTNNMGFSGNGRPDKINLLTVLDNDKKTNQTWINDFTEWKPYEDDLIAFFFYDVVNKKYIPFRATVKGISESNSANWEELKFMGRSDSIYSYSGFTRNLSFGFTVVVNSLVELYPVWQRLNYIASSVKPANYTRKDHGDNITNRFMIPPMFMVTIGDMYKHQPIVMTSVTINIPESAVWEVVPENSSEDWSYLGKIIKGKVDKSKVAQVPREIEVSITCNLLEKERAVVGGNHYGHAPYKDDETGFNEVQNSPFLPSVNGFSKNIRSSKPVKS